MSEQSPHLQKKQEAQKQAQQEAKRVRDRELSDVRKVLSIVEGRRVLWRILCEAGLYRDPFVPKATDMTCKNLGKQDMGRFVLGDIDEADPNAYYRMHTEYVSEEKQKEKEKEDAKTASSSRPQPQ